MPPLLVAGAVLGLFLFSTVLTVGFTDYEQEALPAVDALTRGDLGGFLGALPTYGGSLIIRAPAALLTSLLGGGELAIDRALAVPCLAAAALLAVHLWSLLAAPASPRRAGAAAWIALGVVAANPLILPALDTGHPEELLGAVLCAAAVLTAWRDRPVASGLLLGLAGANKAWAVLAVAPCLLAARDGSARARIVAVAGMVAALVVGPIVLHGSTAVGGTQALAGSGAGSEIFQPWQWTWFFGHHGDVVQGLYAEKPGFRTAPDWVFAAGHLPVLVVPLVVGVGVALRVARREDALLLLAATFLLRCTIDPWNTAYYHLPFVLALAAHEVVARRRPPVGAAMLSGVIYGTCVLARDHLSPDAQSALYLAWSVPVAAVLLAAVAQLTVVRSFGSPERTSWPSSVTMTRSSIRTPTAPGT